MKLARFSAPEASGLGVVADDIVYDVRKNVPFVAPSIVDLLSSWGDVKDFLEAAIKVAPQYRLSEVKLLAPIPRPGKILAIAKNYAAHAEEMGGVAGGTQNWFCKHSTGINHPFDPVVSPSVSEMLDYEAELVVVISKTARHVPRERAHEIIGGYMCGCDYTVRDWQRATPNMMIGKSFDTHAPIGPWVTTADEIDSIDELRVKCFVNDEKRQDAPAKGMIFTLADQIEHLTKVMTLEPGDLIFTGTPEGVGHAAKPPRYLKPGDKVTVEIDKLGSISAPIVSESAECVIS